MLCVGVNISLILAFPLVGNPSGVMLYTEQYSRAKKDSGQAGMTSLVPRNLLWGSSLYFKEIRFNNFFQKIHFFLLAGLCLLALISFGFFCYDSDPFDNNDLPDLSYQYPSISSQHIDQVTFIDILNQSNEISLIFSNSLLTRSPPV